MQSSPAVETHICSLGRAPYSRKQLLADRKALKPIPTLPACWFRAVITCVLGTKALLGCFPLVRPNTCPRGHIQVGAILYPLLKIIYTHQETGVIVLLFLFWSFITRICISPTCPFLCVVCKVKEYELIIKKSIPASKAGSPHFKSAQSHNWFIPQSYSLSFSLLTGCSFLTEVINMIFALWWCTFPCFHMLSSLSYPKRVSEERKWWSISSPSQKALPLDLLFLKQKSW